MSKMIQVRDVPVRLHRGLVRQAKLRSQSLTDYLRNVLNVLEREVARPATEEVIDRIAGRTPVDLGGPAADLLRRDCPN